MYVSEALAAAAALLGVAALLWRRRGSWSAAAAARSLRCPPGPRGLPWIGNALDVDMSSLHVRLTEWSKLYGGVFKFSMFGQDVVVLSSRAAVHDALVVHGSDFAGRPYLYRGDRITYGKDIIFQDYNKTTAHLKQLSSSAVRAYGAGMERLEHFIADAIRDFLCVLDAKAGVPTDLAAVTRRFLCHMLATLLYGEKYSYDDPMLDKISVMNTVIMECCDPYAHGWQLDFAPWLRHIGLPVHGLRKMREAEALRRDVLEVRVNEAKKRSASDEPRGVLDVIVNKTQGSDVAIQDGIVIDDQHLTAVCMNLIVAGIETTFSTMSAVYHLLVSKPEVQQRIYEEILRAIGSERLPCLSDREKMPYTQAFIEEVLRFYSTVPLLVPKMTTTDTSVLGFYVPKGTMVFVNGWGIHHDETVYERPYEFMPERFLDLNGSLLPVSHPIRASFVGFGLGRRVCLGEQLARSRIFLLTTSLVQKFLLTHDEAHPLNDLDPRALKLNLVLEMPAYTLRAVARA